MKNWLIIFLLISMNCHPVWAQKSANFNSDCDVADFDSDCDVDFDDFFLFADHFGTNITSDNWDPSYDLDNDGDVDFDDFFLFADCFGWCCPEIQIVGLQLSHGVVQGIVECVDPNAVRVVLWAGTDQWYVQPFVNDPYTAVASDGTWRNSTHPWDKMVALLVDSTYIPVSPRHLSLHPSSDLGVLAWDEYPSPTANRTIDFSGYSWQVKEANFAGPGPNYFSKSEANVWVDEAGLHLKIEYRDGRWYCAEVYADQSLGYGEYTFQVGSRIDSLDYRAVFAGFIYDSDAREVDLEFSRALANPDNAQYVVQPYYHPGNILRFPMPSAPFSTHRFVWRSDSIQFTSWAGLEKESQPDSVIQAWTYTGPDIPPPGGERMRFNLWLFAGKPPLDEEGDEVIVKSFYYQSG